MTIRSRVLVGLFAYTLCATSQSGPSPKVSISIHVISGSGKPFKGHVHVGWDEDPYVVNAASDAHGVATVQVPAGTKRLFLSVGSKPSEPYRVGYIPCAETDPAGYSFQEVLRSGLTLRNECGSAQRQARPGEIVYYEKKMHFWQDLQ